MILLLDNYDSFVHNVARILRELGEEVVTVRNDEISVADAIALGPSHLVISPGPCTPAEAGIGVDLVRAVAGRVPVLGICLGHQVVAAAYGAPIVPSPEPAHGVANAVLHEGVGILSGIPSPFHAGLYHSLSVRARDLPHELVPAAWSRAGEVMALRHTRDPVWGVQFHPESVLTPNGPRILANFLALRGPAVPDRDGANPRAFPIAGRA